MRYENRKYRYKIDKERFFIISIFTDEIVFWDFRYDAKEQKIMAIIFKKALKYV